MLNSYTLSKLIGENKGIFISEQNYLSGIFSRLHSVILESLLGTRKKPKFTRIVNRVTNNAVWVMYRGTIENSLLASNRSTFQQRKASCKLSLGDKNNNPLTEAVNPLREKAYADKKGDQFPLGEW